jgi:hypothetical protein
MTARSSRLKVQDLSGMALHRKDLSFAHGTWASDNDSPHLGGPLQSESPTSGRAGPTQAVPPGRRFAQGAGGLR